MNRSRPSSGPPLLNGRGQADLRPASNARNGGERGLRKSLGLPETTLGGIGIILGAGIYALVGAVAAEAGNAIWLSFVIAAAVATMIGVCYAELASMFPRAGADYEYSRQALGPKPAFVVGWLMVIGNIIAAATMALGFGSYLNLFVDVSPTVAAVCALVVATLIAFHGIREAIWVTIVGTLVEAAGLIFVIVIGLPHVGEVDLLELSRGQGGVMNGSALVMFAYIGFSQIAALSEETQDARRMVPLAILLSIGVTTSLYVLVAVSAVAVLGWEALSRSDAPLADVASDVLGNRASEAIAVIALFSTANTMLLVLVAASRLIYGMASESALPRFLSWVDPGRQTPVRAIALSLFLACAFSLTGDLSFVAGATNFAVFIGFVAVCISLIVLRYKRPDARRPFRVPLSVFGLPVVAIIGLLATGLLLSSLGAQVLIVGVALFLSGVLGMEVLSLWRPASEDLDDVL